MTKKIIEVELGTLDLSYCNFKEAHDRLLEARALYGDDSMILLRPDKYDGPYIAIMQKRLETDEEYKARLDKSKRAKDMLEKQRRHLYETLRAEYGE